MQLLKSRPYLAVLVAASAACALLPRGVHADSKIRFATVGDIMSHQAQLDTAFDRKCDCYRYDEVFRDIKPFIERADWAIGNLETTLPGEKKQYSGYPTFGSPDSLVDALRHAGFDMLTLSNNHSIDKGREAVIRTKAVVQQKGLVAVGSYTDEAERAREPVVFREIRGSRFAFINYSYGSNGIPVPPGVVVNQFDIARVREDIALARKSADAVVVLYHFGTEYRRDPDVYQRYAVDVAFQEGADVVVGGHPHVLQPFETRTVRDRYGRTRDRLVIWSLGNFVSNQQKRYTDGGMIFEFAMERKKNFADADGGWQFSDLSYLPVWVQIDHSGASPVFRVLPCRDYVAIRRKKTAPDSQPVVVAGQPYHLEILPKGPRPVPDHDRQRIRLFYGDTLELMGSLPSATVE